MQRYIHALTKMGLRKNQSEHVQVLVWKKNIVCSFYFLSASLLLKWQSSVCWAITSLAHVHGYICTHVQAIALAEFGIEFMN